MANTALDKIYTNIDVRTEIELGKFLSEEAMSKVQKLIPEFLHAEATTNLWRTETEIRCSVLNDKAFPDRASKYHQAKVEQLVFFEELLRTSFEYRREEQNLIIIETEIEELQEQITDLTDYKRKRQQAKLEIKYIEKQEQLYKLEKLRRQGEERVRELEIWSKVKSELDDGTFDVNYKDTNQLISLTRRYIQEAFNVHKFSSHADISGVNNIIGQFETLCRECMLRGLMPNVMQIFEGTVIEQFVHEYFK